MPKKDFIPQKEQAWIEARRRFHLSHAQIQMARELGLNPGNFAKLANHQQEPWKAPLAEFIARLYFQRLGKTEPDNVRSIEQIVNDRREKNAANKGRRERARQPASTEKATAMPLGVPPAVE